MTDTSTEVSRYLAGLARRRWSRVGPAERSRQMRALARKRWDREAKSKKPPAKVVPQFDSER